MKERNCQWRINSFATGSEGKFIQQLNPAWLHFHLRAFFPWREVFMKKLKTGGMHSALGRGWTLWVFWHFVTTKQISNLPSDSSTSSEHQIPNTKYLWQKDWTQTSLSGTIIKMLFVLQMARILGNCAPALDYSQEARKLWAKLGVISCLMYF